MENGPFTEAPDCLCPAADRNIHLRSQTPEIQNISGKSFIGVNWIFLKKNPAGFAWIWYVSQADKAVQPPLLF